MDQHTTLFGGTVIPEHVTIETVADMSSLYDRVGKLSMGGVAGTVLWGTAFKQGQRLQFSSAVPLSTFLAISKVEQSDKGDNVSAVKEKMNRPEEKAHAKSLRDYLLATACEREKFILPSFTVTFGTGLFPDSAKVRLIIFAAENGGDERTFPALLIVPRGARLSVTDGGHRKNQLDLLLSEKGPDDEQKDALRDNAVSLTILFESNIVDSHQDFADCGKSKMISKSLLTAFDQRDEINRLAVALVERSPFLKHYTNATSNTVNLSGRSKQAWSMSAWRNFVGHVKADGVPPAADTKTKMEFAPEFIRECVAHIPELEGLEKLRETRSSTNYATPADLRETRGGSVLMRSVGISLLARAFTWAQQEGYRYEEVARALGRMDWHLLTIQRSELPTDEATAYAEAVWQAATPMWRSLLVVGDLRFRVAASKDHAERAFGLVRAKIEADWAENGIDPVERSPASRGPHQPSFAAVLSGSLQ